MGWGYEPSYTIEKMCACRLEEAVSDLGHYCKTGVKELAKHKSKGYCWSLTLKTYQELHGEVYTPTELSVQNRQLRKDIAVLEERLAKLENITKANAKDN